MANDAMTRPSGLVRVSLALALLAAAPAASRASPYANDEFSFAADLPEHYRICTNEPHAPDRGFVLLLNGDDCTRTDDVPRISLSLSYNASLQHRTTLELAQHWCSPAPATWSALRISGTRLMQCARPRLGSLEQRMFIGLRSQPRRWFGQWTVVAIFVQCEPSAMPGCVATVEKLIRNARWRG